MVLDLPSRQCAFSSAVLETLKGRVPSRSDDSNDVYQKPHVLSNPFSRANVKFLEVRRRIALFSVGCPPRLQRCSTCVIPSDPQDQQ